MSLPPDTKHSQGPWFRMEFHIFGTMQGVCNMNQGILKGIGLLYSIYLLYFIVAGFTNENMTDHQQFRPTPGTRWLLLNSEGSLHTAKAMRAKHGFQKIYGVIAKFLYPDSDEKHFHCVFTELRLISSIAPTNLKYIQKTCE